ncbi:MAG: 3-deoxy-D-manno-octulosonic acid transferase [Pelosinus sp.]|nr:3-deoxy-D-manno-octulosonic acid transferase [Pelosinus sp.]
MHFLYDLLAILIVIAAMPVFVMRLMREEGFGERLKQSFGFLPPETLAKVAHKDCIWLHAASVGEIVATSPIIKELRLQMPDRIILVSVVTASGYAMAKRIIAEADGIIFFPFDLPWLSRRTFARIMPGIFAPVETELWPNFLAAARKYHVPVVMVNGRISEKSLERYHYLRGVLKDMLGTVTRFCMQSTIDAQYIIRLGADPHRVVVTGNTKFDQTYTDIDPAEKARLILELGLKEIQPIIVAGSTHKGEEEQLFKALQIVKTAYPGTRMILAPRDIIRTEEIIVLAGSFKLQAVKRTALPCTGQYDVLILDTIGELGKIYSMGDIIFVGGSLIPRGGHNILEPAAHGKPILVGPHMFNFKDSYALFSGRGACATVYDEAELAAKILSILGNKEVYASMSNNTRTIIRENRGAARKSIVYLREFLAEKV